MERKIIIAPTSMTRQEYIQTGFETVRRLVVPLYALVTLAVVAIALAINDLSVRSLVPPYVLVTLGLGAYWLMVRLSWKEFLTQTIFSYEIDDYSWKLTIGEETAEVRWSDTVRMTVRRHIVLLYNEDNRSNMLPRRSLTPDELDLLKRWYRDSREDYKITEAAKDAKFRADYRARRDRAKRERRNRWRGSNHL